MVRIDAGSGKVLDLFKLPAEPAKTPQRGKLAVAASASGTLFVAVANSILEISPAGKQIRTVAITPQRSDKIERIELVKGSDDTAPIVMAVTVETGE